MYGTEFLNFFKFKNEIFFIRKLDKSETKKDTPYELSVFYKSYVYHKKIKKTEYEEYYVDSSEMV